MHGHIEHFEIIDSNVNSFEIRVKKDVNHSSINEQMYRTFRPYSFRVLKMKILRYTRTSYVCVFIVYTLYRDMA